MEFVSFLGIAPVIILLVGLILFGVNFKKGLFILNVLAWCSIAIVFAKVTIDFPRPPDVDSTIKSNYENPNHNLNTPAPQNFWDSFSAETLQKTRQDQVVQYGFPSGHAAIQTTLWISIFYAFRKRWILALGASIIVLTSLSLLYLGSHFLADVLAGALLGFIISLLLILLVKYTKYEKKRTHQAKSLSLLWIPLLLFPFSPFLNVSIMGAFLGLNAAAGYLILKRNFPVFHLVSWKRWLAAFIGICSLLICLYLNLRLRPTGIAYADVLVLALLDFLLFYGSISLSRRLGLMRFRY
jgi:membrane-associated phospholipid phosphatase